METLNIQCIEQQQVLITLTLTDSNGAPVDLTQYAVYAASVGAVDPYCRRAARLEWAAAINNECSAFIVTAPGHDIARAPWKYQICIKNRQLGLEWAVVSGRVELTPRACGTDGISPAAYSISAECTPSGLVNVSLDATVGSISGTLEEVKASAALASSSAANAHADLEDARKAAATAAQAATTAAADANNAADAAARAEKAATDAPQACAPFVGQVQSAAVQAQQAATHAEDDANRASVAATTATEKAQVATDAAAAAAGSATDLASARDTAVQAATTAQAAQQTAQLASTTATTAADNAQQAATRAEDAATRAEAATPAATRAEAARDAAEAAASTATTAAADLPGLMQRAESAATASEAAKQAAETAQQSAETAASTATQQAEAAAASATQADTDARACAIYEQRVAANATAAADSATAAADSATAAADSATAAAESAASVDVFATAAQIAAGTASMEDGIIMSGLKSADSYSVCVTKNYNTQNAKCDYLIIHGSSSQKIANKSVGKCLFSDAAIGVSASANQGALAVGKDAFVHLPNATYATGLFDGRALKSLTLSPTTTFDKITNGDCLLRSINCPIKWATGTTFNSLKAGSKMFEGSNISLPDTVTFRSLTSGYYMFYASSITNLPAAMELTSLIDGTYMLAGCSKLEIEDIVRVCLTINDLQALEAPKTGSLGLPANCKHNGKTVDTQAYLNANHPDFLLTLNARGWTVTFA